MSASVVRGLSIRDGRQTLSPKVLSERVACEQQWLETRWAADTRFAILADNGIPWVMTDLALMGASRLNVPVPGYFTAAQTRHVLNDAGIDVIITDDPARLLREQADWVCTAQSNFSGLYCLERVLPAVSRATLPVGTTKITYTSGSTGDAKGVCLDTESLNRVATSVAEVIRPLEARRHLCLLPLATLLDNLATTLVASLLDAESIVPSLEETGIRYGALEIPRLLTCISQYQPDSLVLVPELLRVLIAAIHQGWSAPKTLKFIAVGGASVSPQLLAQAAAANLPVFEGYGLSECASVVTLNRPGEVRPGSAGRPLPHAQVRIDEHGEIHVSGATMLGYLGTESDHQEIATGDLGYFDEQGYLHVIGRIKNTLITSFGRNISPEWIERELLALPEIAQAVIVGEGRPFVSALLLPTKAETPDSVLTALITRINARLPDYARIGAWRKLTEPFSVTNHLLTANGRPRRAQITDRYAAVIADIYMDSLKEVS